MPGNYTQKVKPEEGNGNGWTSYSTTPQTGQNTYHSDKPNPSEGGRGYTPRPAPGTSGDANSPNYRPPMSKKWVEK